MAEILDSNIIFPLPKIEIPGYPKKSLDQIGKLYDQNNKVVFDQSIANELHLPSSRYYHVSKKDHVLPVVAVYFDNDIEQLQRDYEALIDIKHRPKVYAVQTINSSSYENDFKNIIEGKQIKPQNESIVGMRRYITGMMEYLSSTNQFAIKVDHIMIDRMIRFPFNINADWKLANILAHAGTVKDIQQYLDNIGVLIFRAEDIYFLDAEDIFFYLTRFFGPLPLYSFETEIVRRQYLKAAKNEVTKRIAKQITDKRIFDPSIGKSDALLDKFKEPFDRYFDILNQNPYSVQITQDFDTNNAERVYNDFFSYLELLSRPQDLPNPYAAKRWEDVQNALWYYTDNEIIQMIATNIDTSSRFAELVPMGVNSVEAKSFSSRLDLISQARNIIFDNVNKSQ